MEIFIVKFKFVFLRKIKLFFKLNLLIVFLALILVKQNKVLEINTIQDSEKLVFTVENYYTSASKLPSVEVDNTKIIPLIKGENIYIPIIELSKKTNTNVFFLETKNKVIIANEDYTIEMWLNEKGMILNDEYIETNLKPFEKNEKIYVSLDNIAKYLDFKVDWDGKNQNIIIDHNKQENQNVKFWHYNKILLDYIEMSYEENNKKEIDGIYIPQEDYYEIVMIYNNSESLPDVLCVDYQNLNAFLNDKDIYEDLNLFNVKKTTSNMYDFVMEYGKDNNGNLKVLSDFINPVVLLYNKDLAKKYLGTDNPDKLFEFIGERKFLENSSELIHKMNKDGVNLFLNEYELEAISDKNESRDAYNELISFTKESNILSKENYLSEEWNDKFRNSESIFYYMPLWKVYSDLILNDSVNLDNWGVIDNKKQDISGGIWYGIIKESECKYEAFDFIEYITANEEYLKENAIRSGEYPNSVLLTKVLFSNKEISLENEIYNILGKNLLR